MLGRNVTSAGYLVLEGRLDRPRVVDQSRFATGDGVPWASSANGSRTTNAAPSLEPLRARSCHRAPTRDWPRSRARAHFRRRHRRGSARYPRGRSTRTRGRPPPRTSPRRRPRPGAGQHRPRCRRTPRRTPADRRVGVRWRAGSPVPGGAGRRRRRRLADAPRGRADRPYGPVPRPVRHGRRRPPARAGPRAHAAADGAGRAARAGAGPPPGSPSAWPRLDPPHRAADIAGLLDRTLPVELGEAADRRQRCAQLVAGVGAKWRIRSSPARAWASDSCWAR